MPRYAADTTVSVDKSRAEIERTILRYGANGFRFGWVAHQTEGRIEQIEFTVCKRMVRFTMRMPSPDNDEFKLTPAKGWERSKKDQMKAWEKGCRQRWRALYLAIKAKLEAVECGISVFEEEFLAQIVDPKTKQTMAELILPQIEQRYAGLEVRIGLPGLPSPEEFADSEA